MKIQNKILSYLICGGIIFGSGIYTGNKLFKTKPEIKIVEKTKIKYKTINRDYSTYKRSSLENELIKYDTGKPFLDGKIKDNIFYAEAGLNKRKWKREFKLDVSVKSNSNWKYYFIIGGIGILTGGYIIYKIKR